MAGTTYDVIIVGSGFGGSVCAARLAERGMRVLVLERGPWWGPLNRHRPRRDRREYPRVPSGSRKIRGARFHETRRGPAGPARKLVRDVRWVGTRRREWLANADGLLEVHRFRHLFAITASGVGGGSHAWTAILEEPDAAFFDAYPPEITADEMRPYFQRVRDMFRPAPVPDTPEKNRVFAYAAARAGFPTVETPDLAVAWGADPRHPEPVTNAAGVDQSTSTYQGDAFIGSQDGSKGSTDLTYIPIALRHGAEVRPLCEVTGIGAGRDHGYEVAFVDHRSGQRTTEAAPRLVLAAGCLNTLRLLFAARDGALPGLPPTLGQRFSVNGDWLSLVWRSSVLADSTRGTSFNAFVRVTDDGAHRYLTGEVGVPGGLVPAPLRPWLRRSTFLFSMGRDEPAASVGFDGTGITTSVRRSLNADLFDDIEQTTERIAGAYRAQRVIPARGRIREALFTVHPMGGCALAPSPQTGVTDHTGQVFGHPGLYVADGSLYPRSPGIAPSMTIAAIAERQAGLIR